MSPNSYLLLFLLVKKKKNRPNVNVDGSFTFFAASLEEKCFTLVL